MTSHSSLIARRLSQFGLLALVAACVSANAATIIWNGGSGGNANTWNRAQNWVGSTQPGAADTAQFDNTASATNLAPSIATTATSIGAITFANGTTNAYNISGTQTLTLSLAAGITNLSATNQQFGVSTITLGTSQSWTAASTGTLSFTGTTINFGSTQLTVAGAGNTSIANAITATAAQGSLVKDGAGTLTLSNASIAYNAGTTVNAGTLRVNGTMTSATNAVTVNTGATLAGTGTIAGATTLNSGGFIAPGAPSIGTLTLGSLTFNGGGTLNLGLGAGTSSDKIAINGAFTQGSAGQYTIDFGNGGDLGSTYQLVTFTGGTNFLSGSAFNFVNLAPGLAGSFALSGNDLTFTTTVIPEPSTYAAILGAGALGMVIYRRRKARSTSATAETLAV